MILVFICVIIKILRTKNGRQNILDYSQKTKRTLLSAVLITALLLSGCSSEGGRKTPQVSISSNREIPLESNAQIINSNEDIPPESDPQTVVSDPVSDGMSISLCGSPSGIGSDNYRQLTIKDGVITISGSIGENGLREITASMSKVDLKKNGSEFTCTISNGPMLKGYISVYLEDERGMYSDIRMRFVNGKFEFPNVLGIAESNLSLVSGEISKDAKGITLKNITESGTADNAEKVLEEIRKISDEICSGTDSDYEKLRLISRWVSSNIYYDHDAYSAGIPQACLSLEYMLKNNRSVCGGYANMTAALAQAQGITCYSIAGEAVTNQSCYAEVSKGEVHEWNYAVIDGRGIWVDSGWNSNNHYRKGKYSDDTYGTKYFDIGNEYFALNHKALRISDRNFFGIS